jgi:hypothetical protein
MVNKEEGRTVELDVKLKKITNLTQENRAREEYLTVRSVDMLHVITPF